MSDMNNKMNAWVSQEVITKPTSEEMETILKEAEKDHYGGKVGIKEETKKLVYRPSKEIKWGTSEHGFGSGK